MGEKKRTLRGFLCAALGGVCWGASGTVGQYLFTCQGVDSGWLTVVRMFLAGVVLLGGALVRHRPQLRAIWSDRRDALRLVLFSVGGLMTCQYTYLAAIRYSNSATATVLQYMGQALILLWVCLRARRLPTRREGAALVLALLGAFLLATHGSLTALALSPQALFWGLCAAVSLMLYTLLPGDLLRRYPVSVCTGCGMFIGGVVLLVLTQAWRIPVALNAAVALGTLEISVVGTALAFTLYLQGVSDIGGVRASLLACTEPVSAALCAALWLHTSFAWQDLLGFAAILVMAVLIALPERASEKSTEKAKNWKKRGPKTAKLRLPALIFSLCAGLKAAASAPASPQSRRGWRSPRPARPAVHPRRIPPRRRPSASRPAWPTPRHIRCAPDRRCRAARRGQRQRR